MRTKVPYTGCIFFQIQRSNGSGERVGLKLEIPKGSYISIDGKTLRGSGHEKSNLPLLHLPHAYRHALGVVLGEKGCRNEKKNEINACIELLDSLKIEKAVIMADAMMCQKKI